MNHFYANRFRGKIKIFPIIANKLRDDSSTGSVASTYFLAGVILFSHELSAAKWFIDRWFADIFSSTESEPKHLYNFNLSLSLRDAKALFEHSAKQNVS